MVLVEGSCKEPILYIDDDLYQVFSVRHSIPTFYSIPFSLEFYLPKANAKYGNAVT